MRNAGESGYHTFRIPSVIATSKGTLLAFAEGRRASAADAGDIDLVLKRSADGGASWSRLQVVGDNGPNTIGNPCPVLDRSTGAIWLLTTRNRGTDREQDIIAGTSQTGRTVWIMKSVDEGATWSEAVEITAAVKRPDWTWYATGPGVGIQTSSGRLVIPVSRRSAVTIVNVGYRSTNYWVVSAGTSRLLVDFGWPGSMAVMRANLRRAGIPLDEIKYGLATHYHIDHAGLAQDLKNAGVPLLVIDLQVPFIPLMKRAIKPQDHFTDIALEGNVTIPVSESRALLNCLGIAGEIVPTPGHSDDSVSLLLDDGSAFTGDLTHPMMIGAEDADAVRASWDCLKDLGATQVYPGHGRPHPPPLVESGAL